MVQSGTVKAPRLFVLADDTLVCVTTYQGGLYVFLSRAGGVDWTPALPLDISCYGYPGGLQMEDDRC